MSVKTIEFLSSVLTYNYRIHGSNPVSLIFLLYFCRHISEFFSSCWHNEVIFAEFTATIFSFLTMTDKAQASLKTFNLINWFNRSIFKQQCQLKFHANEITQNLRFTQNLQFHQTQSFKPSQAMTIRQNQKKVTKHENHHKDDELWNFTKTETSLWKKRLRHKFNGQRD